MDKKQAMLIYELAKQGYADALRELLVSAIDDPNKKWDDITIEFMDAVFAYGSNGNPFYTFAKILYSRFLRDLLLDAVESTDTEWDDRFVLMFDKVFKV